MPSSVINLAKHERVVIKCPPPLLTIYNEKDKSFSYSVPQLFPNTVQILHVKPASDRLEKVHQRETVEKNDGNRLNNGWPKEVKIIDRSEKHKLEFLKMLEELVEMWDCYLGRSRTSRYRIDLATDDVQSVQSVPYFAGPTAG